MIQSSNKLIVKDPFEMPDVEDTVVLTLRECGDLVPHCWIWNASVGYLEVLEYSGFDIFVTVKNTGMSENASSGTVFPSCMEFLITAPNATPIIDNTVTCLKADFNSPTVGQTALMSVENTSAIKAGDLIVVARDYQYVVSEVINDTTLLVLNDGKGKEGVIHIDCKTCTPVKIFESTYCCNILQEEIDEINGKFEERKSIIPWSGNSLVTISGGTNALISEYDTTIKVDDNLANFDNSESNFATEEDLPTKTSDLENDSGFITSADLPTVNDATLTIYNTDGATPFVSFSANASTDVTVTIPQATSTTDGYLSSTDWNTFNSKASSLVYFEEALSGTTARFQPKSGSATYFDLGASSNEYSTAYIATIRKDNSYISLPSDGGNMSINCGTPGTYGTNYGNIYFRVGRGDKLTIGPSIATFAVNINPDYADSRNIGTSTKYFNEGWINYIKTNQLNTVMGTSISVQADLNPGSNGSQSIGNINYFNTIHGETVKVKNLVPGAGNSSSIIVKTADDTGTVQLYSSTSTSNIGTTSNQWSNGYFANLYGTDCFFNNVEPRASGNVGYVGKSTHYYSQMHCTTLQQHSDRKDKENIIERNSAKGAPIKSLDKINSLKTYTFNFKEGDNIRTHLGMMADEVYRVEPLCASLLEDDTPGSKSTEGTPTGIDLGAMITLLLEGIKELSSEVKGLKSKLGE